MGPALHMNTKFPDGAGTGIVAEAHDRALKNVREERVSGRL